MKALLGATLLAVSSLGLAACAGDGTSAGQGRDVALDLSGPAATVTAAPGDTITLRLAENPSTGHMWRRGDPLPDGVVELGNDYVPDPLPTDEAEIIVGSGGTRVFTYRCDRATAGPIDFKLYPPGSLTTPVEERQATLTCR